MLDGAPLGTVSFDDEPEKVSFTSDTASLPPSDVVSAQKAIKADYAMGEQSPGAGTLYSAIGTGEEQNLRQSAAVDESIRFAQRKNAMIGQIAREHGATLTPDHMSVLQSMTQSQWESDPQDVFERKFTERFTTDAIKANEHDSQSPMRLAMEKDPQRILDEADISQHATLIREVAKTKMEQLKTEWDNTGWVSATAQFAGQFVPLLSAYNLHNVMKGPSVGSLLPGTNLGEQVDNLLRLPYEQGKKALEAAVAEVNQKSTLDAMTLVQAVISYTSSDSFINNVVGITDVGGLASVASKGVFKAVKAGTLAAADRISLARAARQRAAKATPEDSAEAAVKEMQSEIGMPPAQPKTYYIPEKAAQALETVELPAKGAKIEIKTADGKRQPIRPTSDVVYVTPQEAEALGNPGRLLELKDGRLAASNQAADGQWSLPFERSTVIPKTEPAEGLVPVELGGRKKFMGSHIYSEPKIGARIEEVIHADPEPIFHTDVKNGVTVVPGKPGEGMVPVHVAPDGTVTFSPTIRGDTYHFPAEAVKRLKPIQKFGRTPDYSKSVVFDKNGKPLLKVGDTYYDAVEQGPGTVAMEISKDAKHVDFLMTGAERDARKALGDISKAVASPEMRLDNTFSQVGDHSTAAKVNAAKKIEAVIHGSGPDELIRSLPSALNPTNPFGKGAALSQTFADRLVEKLTRGNDALIRLLGQLDVSRLTPQAVQTGLVETEAKLRRIYGGRVNDGIIDFLHIPPELNPSKTNLDTVVMRLGDLNALPFTSRARAEQYMTDVYKLSPDEAFIGQQGSSFYVQVAKHIDETTPGVIEAIVTPRNSTPVSFWNMLLNRVRTSEDLLSDVQRDNRHIATHAPQILNKVLREQIDETARALTRGQRKKVEEILRLNRDEINSATNERGIFYTSLADFEQAYQARFRTLPTEKEAEHYFNYTRLSDFDYVIRNLAMYRDKGRLGIERFNFSFQGPKGVNRVPDFEGKELEAFPWGGQNAGILVHDSQEGTRLLYKHGQDGLNDTTTRKTVDDLVKERGFKIIQVFDPTARPFKDVEFPNGKIGEQVHFVITDASDRKALSFQQLKYRPGGHSIYQDDWYVKQPQMQIGQAGRLHYYGDNAIMNFATEAEAIKYSQRMDTARVMLKNNDPGLDAYLARNIPYTRADFEKMFNSGHLNIDVPIVHTRSGASTFETVTSLKPEYRDVVDATKSEYNLAGSIDQSFTADRNAVLNTVDEKTFQIAPSRQIDPYQAMNRGLGQGVRNLWMNDYKIGAVQSWLQEFGDVMKPNFKTLSNNPMYFLYHPQFNEAVVDKARLAAAKANQRAIVNFVGAQSELGGQITFLQNKLMNTIYEKAGQGTTQFVADYLLPAIKDPASYVRAVAFHSKLGFFNPIQMFVQMQSLSNVLAIAGPTHGVPGASAAFLMRRLAHTSDEGVIDHFAGMAANLGWKKDDFKQMYEAFRKTGLYEVAGEAALRDDVFDPKLYRSTVGHWLDKGTFFFNEGERAVRLTAFATAYREFKAANEGLQLGNREIGQIMSRADTLSASMTRASAASWQTGLMSIPTQFMTYNARIAEQMFSKRLTSAEKARMFATYAALYGVPTSVAATVGVWPFYDDIREEAMKRGYDMSATSTKLFFEGTLSTAFSAVTGKDYNFSQRYGPGGTTIFRDLLRGDKSAMETLGGASASIIGDIWRSTQPAARSLWGMAFGNSEEFPTRKEDWLTIANNVSTMSLATRVYTAIAYGKYISKNNVQVGDMDNMDAFMSILGVTPQQITDTYIMSKAGKEDQQVKKDWEDAALKQYTLGIQAGSNGDEQAFRDYMKRFNTYMSEDIFTVEDRNRIMQKASEYRPDLQQKVREDFWRRAPMKQRQQRMEQFFVNPDPTGSK